MIKSWVSNIIKNDNNLGIKNCNEIIMINKLNDIYIKYDFIGFGEFSKIFKCIKHGNDKIYGLKAIKRNNNNNISDIIYSNELFILKYIKHDNIIKYYNTYINNKYYYIEMEYCFGGNLNEFIYNNNNYNGILNEIILKQFIYKLCDIMKLFHSNNIIHKDIKPQNIMLKYKNNLIDFRLIDFGTSVIIDNNSHYFDKS